MKIAVYGAGAMGTSLGALLTQSGVECHLISRNQEHVNALNERGADLLGEKSMLVPVKAMLPSQISEQYDIIFLTSAQRENQAIAIQLNGVLKADGALVSMQNGLPERRLASVVGEDRVYGCALSWGAERVGAGKVKITSENGYHFSLGVYGNGEKLGQIAQILSSVGEVRTGNLNELRYAKLAINASFSTLSAISGLAFGELSKKYKRQTLALMKEVFAVAKAAGCKQLPLNGHDLFKVFGGVFAGILLPIGMKKYKNTRSGMLKALQNGRRCEVDFVAGAVIEEGERLSVATPCLARAVELVHEIENGFAEIAPESLGLL